jgi:hypothetical protein
MFLLIAVASCTSTQMFSEIYTLVADFLSLSRTSLSMALRGSPGVVLGFGIYKLWVTYARGAVRQRFN